MQHGFHRAPIAALAREHLRVRDRLLARSPDPQSAVLLVTDPHYAAVAESWPGPVVYYATDLFSRYDGWNPRRITALERRLAAVAVLVCPNSSRIAAHLEIAAGCAAGKIAIIPNATRDGSVPSAPLLIPADLPVDLAALPRPVAGVIGALGANTDWIFLREVVASTPWLSWALVGPYHLPIADPEQLAARTALIEAGARVRFLGNKPYGELQAYARALDAAVLPYIDREPTISGSSTRFYEHLAACRPMLATAAFRELRSKEPLVQLASGPGRMIEMLEELRDAGFRDGQEAARWRAATLATWTERASSMLDSFGERAAKACHA